VNDLPRPKRPWLSLSTTLAAQTLGSLCLSVPAVLAPAVAPLLGFGADRVGLFIGIAYLAAMASGLFSGLWVARVGAVGVSELALLAFGMGMLGVTAGQPLMLVGAALVVGTGYGVLNPAAASLLNHHSPPRQRGLFFSIKQAGVPLGVALAGLLMPLGLATIGWRPSLMALGGVCVACAVAMLAARRPLESALRAVARQGGQAEQRSPALVRVLKDPALRRISLCSFAFAFSQLTFMTFLVSYLNLQLGQSLALAAGVLAASQAVSTVSRVGWGYAGDRWFDPGRLLGWLGVGAGAAFVALGSLAELRGAGAAIGATRLEVDLSILAAMACAITAMGWNGVYFAELARRTAPGELATVAGATQFITFFGSMAGPVVFGEILRHGGSYSMAYLVLAALPVVAGVVMLRGARISG
jgi:MFS family permease